MNNDPNDHDALDLNQLDLNELELIDIAYGILQESEIVAEFEDTVTIRVPKDLYTQWCNA